MKILSLLIAIVFFSNNAIYGADHLRVFAGSQDTYDRIQTAIQQKNAFQRVNLNMIVSLLLTGALLLQPVVADAKQNSPESIIDLRDDDIEKAIEIVETYIDEVQEGDYDNLYMLLENADKFINKEWAREVFRIIAEKLKGNFTLRKYSKKWISQPWAPEILKIMYNHPESLFREYEMFASQPYAVELLGSEAILAPVQAIEGDPEFIWGGNGPPTDNRPINLRKDSGVIKLLRNSNDPVVKKLCGLYDWGIKNLKRADQEYALEMALLLDKIVEENLSFEEAYKIAKDPALLLENIAEIKRRPGYSGSYSIGQYLGKIFLKAVAKINELHNLPDAVRFKSVESYDSEMLYNLMVYGENEVFTSTFNGLFTRMLVKMEKEGLTAKTLFEKTGYDKFRAMIKLCAGFNRLNEFLNTMNKQGQIELLERFVRIKDDVNDLLSQAVTIADTFSMVQDKEILKVLQKTIKGEHIKAERENNKEVKVIYGLLSGMFGNKAVLDKDWFREMSKKYSLPDITKMPSKGLFDHNINIQRYYTYNDDDGKASYNSILNQYKGRSDWSIYDKGTYAVIASKSAGGRKIEMYINKPEFEDKGQVDIEKVLKGKEAYVEIHVGHSYHADKTIERINPQAKLVILRSCGGYNEISAILDRAPEAFIISTKGKGTMYINDPLLYLLNKEILKGKDIIWPDFWNSAERILGSNADFKNYIAPHKNLGAIFLKAYKKLIEQERIDNFKTNLSMRELRNTKNGNLLGFAEFVSDSRGLRGVRVYP